MKIKSAAIILSALSLTACGSQMDEKTELMGTPMVGSVNMRSATVWMQLSNSINGSVRVLVLDSALNTVGEHEVEDLGTSNNCLSHVHGLEPGTTYSYVIKSGRHVLSDTLLITTQTLWQYRSDPPSVRIALGSCAYINEPIYDRPGKPYGGGYEIFETIANDGFDAMFWLGDNVYLREADFGSYSGYVHRYNHTRSTPELQTLLSRGVHYAVWDDHDYGPNDCDGSYSNKALAKKAFDAYWPNPSGEVAAAPELNATSFAFADAEVFLLDNRTHRVNDGMGEGKRQMFGKIQLEWLLNNLKNSRAPFKLIAVGGQVVSDAAIYENFAQFPEEREWLLSELNRLNIKGAVFLSGDRHSSELSKLQLPNGNWVYDITVSPLTSGSYDHSEEPNELREPGTMVGERNYGMLEISGPRKERTLRMQIKSAQGALIWERSISAANGHTLAP